MKVKVVDGLTIVNGRLVIAMIDEASMPIVDNDWGQCGIMVATDHQNRPNEQRHGWPYPNNSTDAGDNV